MASQKTLRQKLRLRNSHDVFLYEKISTRINPSVHIRDIPVKWQIGQFLIVVGVLALIIFYVNSLSHTPDLLFFCSGVLIVIGGGALMWSGRKPPEPSERFRTWRKLRQKQDKKK